LLTCFRGGEQVVQSGRVDGAWAHRVHRDAALLQVPLIPPCQTADPCRFIAKLLEISPKQPLPRPLNSSGRHGMAKPCAGRDRRKQHAPMQKEAERESGE
jgi:hypothetical protein